MFLLACCVEARNVGQVIKASDNSLAAQLAVVGGIELSSAWVLVEFDN